MGYTDCRERREVFYAIFYDHPLVVNAASPRLRSCDLRLCNPLNFRTIRLTQQYGQAPPIRPVEVDDLTLQNLARAHRQSTQFRGETVMRVPAPRPRAGACWLQLSTDRRK